MNALGAVVHMWVVEQPLPPACCLSDTRLGRPAEVSYGVSLHFWSPPTLRPRALPQHLFVAIEL